MENLGTVSLSLMRKFASRSLIGKSLRLFTAAAAQTDNVNFFNVAEVPVAVQLARKATVEVTMISQVCASVLIRCKFSDATIEAGISFMPN